MEKLLLGFALLIAHASQAQQAPLTVRTAAGVVRGMTEGEVAIF